MHTLQYHTKNQLVFFNLYADRITDCRTIKQDETAAMYQRLTTLNNSEAVFLNQITLWQKINE